MTADETDRRLVHSKLVEIAGEREADLMMELFSNEDPTAQLASLRAELHIEIAGMRTEIVDRLAAIHKDMVTGFANVDARFANVEMKFADVDAKFAGVDTKFARVDAKFAGVDAKFADVDTKFAEMNSTLAEAMARNERAMRFQLVWLVATMISMTSIAIAVLH